MAKVVVTVATTVLPVVVPVMYELVPAADQRIDENSSK